MNRLVLLGFGTILVGCASHSGAGGVPPGRDAGVAPDAAATTDAAPDSSANTDAAPDSSANTDAAPDSSVSPDAAPPDAGAEGGLALDSGVLINAEGGTPSDYSCAGAVDAGAPQPAAPHPFHVRSLQFTMATGTHLALVDSTGVRQGAWVITDNSGNATLTVPGNSYVSWEVAGQGCPDTCVPTYQFHSLTHTLAEVDAGAVEHAMGWDIDDFVGAVSQLNGTFTLGLAIGTIEDCKGQPVANAHVTATSDGQPVASCVPSGTQVIPCVVYMRFAADMISHTTETGPTGQFAVLGKAGSVITAKASGVPAGSNQPVQLGSMTVRLFQESVSLGRIQPR